MIMILSDGRGGTAEAEKQLRLHGDNYCVFFSDVVSASRYAKGNVLIGSAARSNLAKAYAENNIDVVLDVTEKPYSKLSRAALSACRGKMRYVKYVNCDEYDGAKRCLSYGDVAENIKKYSGRVLICAAPETVSAIAELAGDSASEIYVVLKKDIVFNVERALEYSIPLVNVIEADFECGNDTVPAIKKVGAGLVVIAENSEDTEERVESALSAGADVIVTHSSGVEYPNVFADIRDAIIEIHS